MEIYQIRYFLAVSETLNFTRAAERCYVSQPALTKAIQKLEELLGGRLFDRTKNAVQLTDLGRAMLPNFQQIYATANQTREHAKRLVREQRAVVRVGVMCTVDFNLLLPCFVAYQQAHPKVDVMFREGTLESLTDALDKNEIDLGLMASPHPFAKRFAVTPMFSEDFVIAHGPAHRFAKMKNLALADLRNEPYCERLNCEFSDYIGRVLEERGVDVHTVQETTCEDWIHGMVRAGFGIAYMPQTLATMARLPYVTTDDCAFRRDVGALVLSERPLSDATMALRDALQQFNWGELIAN